MTLIEQQIEEARIRNLANIKRRKDYISMLHERAALPPGVLEEIKRNSRREK